MVEKALLDALFDWGKVIHAAAATAAAHLLGFTDAPYAFNIPCNGASP
jgi:hypothetical protein